MKRVIDTDFWTDSKVVELFSPEDKLFFLYLMTNPHATQLGIYPVSKKVMSFEIGYSLDTINVLLDRFERKYKVIIVSKKTDEIAILNYLKHSIVKGGKPVADLLIKEVNAVKDKTLLRAIFVNLSSIRNLNETVKEILTYINSITSSICLPSNIVNDNENENDNEESYPDSYNDSYHDSSEINKKSAAYCGITAHKAISSFISKFNSVSGLVKYRKPSVNDELAIDRILHEFSEEEIEETFTKLAKSDFLRGNNSMGWKATFDWFIKLDNFKKVFNGNYDNRKNNGKVGKFTPTDLNGQYDEIKPQEVYV